MKTKGVKTSEMRMVIMTIEEEAKGIQSDMTTNKRTAGNSVL